MKFIAALSLSLFLGTPSFAQQESRLTPHLDNYVITDIDEIKFQLSLKYQLLKGGWSEIISQDVSRGMIPQESVERLFFTYTQKSFWDIAEPSSPFSDHNFRPGIMVRLAPDWVEQLDLGYEHESNGRDGDESRGWDRIYADGKVGIRKFDLGLKLWSIIDEGSQNQDIQDFQGNGELSLRWHSNRDSIDTDIQIGVAGRVGSGGDRGNTKAEVQVPLGQIFELLPWVDESIVNPHLMVQYWDGYGEKLLEYDQRESVLRYGLAFAF